VIIFSTSDQLGKVVFTGEIEGSGTINTVFLPTGMYFISLQDSKGNQTKQKLLKQ